MKNNKSVFGIFLLALTFLGLSANQIFAQPSAAQIKKLFTLPNAVSVVVHKPGNRVWSETYKKYVWNIGFTVKNKTETPGVLRIVRGYSSFDIVGGRYIYWRDFISENSYEGIKSPTVADISEAIKVTADVNAFGGNLVIGEYESLKMAAEPSWEWHTMNSVSFNVVGVYRVVNYGGSHGGEPQYNPPQGFKAVDKIEAGMRIRLYRQAVNQPWNNIYISDRIKSEDGMLITVKKLLERKDYTYQEIDDLPRMSKVPVLTR